MHPRKARHFRQVARELAAQTRFAEEAAYIQHGCTSTLLHSLAVAYFSLHLAEVMKLRIAERSLIRGALLHDYFLYDWHDPEGHEGLHGYTHPGDALKNALRDVTEPLNEVEKNIIGNHMFPLTLRHVPTCRESVLVCLVDKVLSIHETFRRKSITYPHLRALESQIAAKRNIEQ